MSLAHKIRPAGPAHPLGEEWLAGLASGTLSEGEAVFTRTCLSLMPDGAERLSLARAMGGALLEEAPAALIRPDTRKALLAALDETEMEEAPAPAPQAPQRKDAVMPDVLQDFAGGGIEEMDWSFLGPGMKKTRLWKNADGQTLWMLRAKPGVQIPEHTHEGTELTLVLKGSFADASGTYRRGDVEESDGTHTHDLVIGPGEECICLALTDSPLKFKGWIARLIQPFVGL